MVSYRHWSVLLWWDPNDVPHRRILPSNEAEWWSVPAPLCWWCCYCLADQLWVLIAYARRRRSDWHVTAPYKLSYYYYYYYYLVCSCANVCFVIGSIKLPLRFWCILVNMQCFTGSQDYWVRPGTAAARNVWSAGYASQASGYVVILNTVLWRFPNNVIYK